MGAPCARIPGEGASDPGGVGVPLTRIRRQYAPFSPTMTGSFGPPAEGSGIRNPPDSVITKSALANRSSRVSGC